MPGLTTAAEKFTNATFATNRAAFSRFVAARGLSLVDPGAKAAARAAFDAQELLQDQQLVALCRSALDGAVGPMVGNVTITIWQHLRRTAGGIPYTFTWPALAAQHAAWAGMVAAKGEGTIYNPTITGNGMRLTEQTRSVSTLILDCDGTGTWDALTAVLASLQIAAITHESGGGSLGTPKWRVLIPLARPFDTSTAEGIAGWRTAYAVARVVFGALASLRGAGFDPATDLVNNAWFPGYRRTAGSPPRRVLYATGATLDLVRLTELVPAPATAPAALARRRWTAASPCLLELAFEESGLLGADLGQGRSAVVCPWNDCHSVPLTSSVEATSASVIFPPTSAANIGCFYCAHSSCGFKSLEEVLGVLPADAVHRARLRHVRGSRSAWWDRSSGLPRLPGPLPRLPSEFP